MRNEGIGIQDNIYRGTKRSPEIKVLLYDQTDNFSEIVLDTAKQTPFDITRYIRDFNTTEQENAASTATFSLISPNLQVINPYIFCGRKVIKVLYRDLADVDAPWLVIFLGVVKGQPGFRKSREETYNITINCEDRSHFFKKKPLNTGKYFEGDDLGDIAINIATNATYGFGLDRNECKFGLFDFANAHSEISLYDVAMLEGLQYLGFVVDKMPGFDMAGFLRYYDTSINKIPARIYDNEDIFKNISWAASDTEAINKVIVTGLSNIMEKVVSPYQRLFSVNGTLGFFQKDYTEKVSYGDDGQGRAQNVGISSSKFDGQIGSKVSNTKAKLKNITEFSATVEVSNRYQTWIFVLFFTIYIIFFIAASVVSIVPWLGQVGAAVTYLKAAIWLTFGLIVMQQIGTFQVEVSGEPFKMVYKEIEGIAEWNNLLPYEINEKKIDNHIIHTQQLADSIARRELERETVKICVREFEMPFDPFLEVHDIIELYDSSRFYITSLNKTFTAREPQEMSVTAFMVRSGNEYLGIEAFPEV